MKTVRKIFFVSGPVQITGAAGFQTLLPKGAYALGWWGPQGLCQVNGDRYEGITQAGRGAERACQASEAKKWRGPKYELVDKFVVGKRGEVVYRSNRGIKRLWPKR